MTDYTAIWDYEAQPKEWIQACNLCDADTLDLMEYHDDRASGTRDRYDFKAASWTCYCGLNFLNPRMTREAYARFYESGAYRRLVSAFHGREINAQAIQPEQVGYGQHLGEILRPSALRLRPRGTPPNDRISLLDLGGSTGVVASQVAKAIDRVNVTVLDPSAAELYYAQEAGHEIMLGTVETLNSPGRTWDVVTLCQTADHLLDLMGSLKKIKGILSPGGLFWSDIVDFYVTREVKIDHPFNLTERTYRQFLDKAGFKLKQINYAPDGVHVGFLCE